MEIKLNKMLYTSRATELGRGNKVTKLSMVPDWTPAPNAYEVKSDFVNFNTKKMEVSVD